MSPPRNDLYESLGLERNATSEDIRRAYRRKALQTHPDRLPQGSTDVDINNAAEQFRNVNNAYEVLNNEGNRRLYDQHGVWPPPNVESQQPDPFDYFDAFGYRARHHNSSRPYAGYSSPFDEDPFFAGFNRRHDQFRFTDPFALFDQMFNDMVSFGNGYGQNRYGQGSSRANGNGYNSDPFSNNQSMNSFHNSFFGPSPFDSFGPFGSFGSSNMIGFGHDDLFGRGMQPMRGFSSYRSSSSIGGNRKGSQSMEMRTQTINGVTHTVKRKTDSEGNQHEERVYPDGRKEILYNGVLQGNEPAKIEGSKKRKKHHKVPEIEAPPHDYYQSEPRTSSGIHNSDNKSHWWSGWQS